jgi:hypothetical protein
MSILDSDYQKKLEELIEKEVKIMVATAISRTDLATEIGKKLAEYIDIKVKASALPEGLISHKAINWSNFDPFSTILKQKSYQNFISTGIQDVAEDIELTIADQVVVVENTLITRHAEVKENFAANDVVVNNITINDTLVFGEKINKQFVSLFKDTLKQDLSTRKFDVVENPIYANGKEILTENTLGPSIINSNLRKLGRLTELNVGGVAQFNDTLIVTDKGKIGINTAEPEGALTVWDDDSELTIKRYKKKNMYIGTMRDTDLSLGVGDDIKLAIRKDGTVAMNHIELGGIKISTSNEIPKGFGLPGQLVIMSNAKEDEPWAYRCIGGDRWKAIK